jgi:hypothetical protein
MFGLIIILVVIGGFTYWIINRTVENPRHWSYSFNGLTFSAEAFYQSVEEVIKRREIPDVEFSRVEYSQSNMFGVKREYLHIVKDEYIYDVCAAPYGDSFFVSMWFVEKPSVTKKLMGKSKVLAELAEKKTYYEADTNAMARAAIEGGFTTAIDEMTSTKGIKGLPESERTLKFA